MNDSVCHILIIDDSPDDLAEARRMLLRGSERRYRFTEAELGREGVRACMEMDGPPPDCVLLDFHLPDMDAPEVLAQLADAEGWVRWPVVVLTGSDSHSGPDVLRAGAQDYIGKTWTSPESHTRAVENAIERFAMFAERRVVDRRLRESEERLRLSRDAAFLISFEWDIVRDEVRRFHSYDPALGPTADDEPNTFEHVCAIVHPEDRALFIRNVGASLEPGAAYYENEFRIVHPGGGIAWLFERGHVKRDAEGRALKLVGLSQDVTTRKQRELNTAFLADMQKVFAPLTASAEIMQRVSERLAAHLSLAHCGLVEIDAAGEVATVLREHRAPGAAPIAGSFRLDEFYTAAELREMAAGRTLLLADVRASRPDGSAEVLAAMGIGSLGIANYLADGRWTFGLVAARAEPGAWSGEDAELLREMAERAYVRIQRARAEERLRVSEEFSRTVLESSPDCVKVLSPSGELLLINGPGMCLLEMEDIAALLGKPWIELWPEEAQPLVRAALEKAARGESAHFEAFRPTAKGTPKIWDVSTAPVRNAAGEVDRIVAVSRDVTERSHSEAALREAKESAEAANRAKDRFLAVFSHELRTPLTPVLMTVAALEHDPDLRADVREDLTMMKRNVELEVKLIDDLLDLSRITSGKLELKIEAVDLNAAVGHVGTSSRALLLEASVCLEMELSAEACTIGADAARLQQVIWNVLRNAIKFTPANGTIRVSTARLAGGRCEVRVRDSGIGIPAEILPRIFDAFEQGDQRITAIRRPRPRPRHFQSAHRKTRRHHPRRERRRGPRRDLHPRTPRQNHRTSPHRAGCAGARRCGERARPPARGGRPRRHRSRAGAPPHARP